MITKRTRWLWAVLVCLVLWPAFAEAQQEAWERHMRADERFAAGDMEGEAVWLRILKAIEELLSEERPEETEVH